MQSWTPANAYYHAILKGPRQAVYSAEKLHAAFIILEIEIYPPVLTNTVVTQLPLDSHEWIGYLESLV